MAILAMLLALLLLLSSSSCGVALSQRMPWSEAARAAGLPVAVGLGLAPFIAGLVAVAALLLLPGFSHEWHLIAVLVLLSGAALFGLRAPSARQLPGIALRGTRIETAIMLVLAGYVVALLADCVMLPLLQNDALEYATVARILFESRDLASYPALDPAATASGFYGPWTHPPLYVSLLYLADVIQRSADSSTALRFIAPWCMLAATGCVACAGRLVSRLVGLLAALIFLSTPLLFLGAASALIDPLAVLGFTLVAVTAMGVEGAPCRVGASLGIVLGLSLWAHSQAVVFPFLALPLLMLRIRESPSVAAGFRAATVSSSVAVAVAAVIGAFPYIRNLIIYGVMVSDSPAVFRIATLDWASYFSFQRGLSGISEVLQYGLFKGLFAIEAYSISFWLAVLAVPSVTASVWRSVTGRHAPNVPATQRVLGSALIICALYMCFLLATALAGIDVAVRNERYTLVVMPAVALLAAFGLTEVASWTGRLGRLFRPLPAMVVAAVTLQLLVMTTYRARQLAVDGRGEIAAPGEARLDRWGPFGAVRYLRDNTPANSVVLTLKPADMYYARRKMVSYLDPRLAEAYASDNAEAFAGVLRKLGVNFVHAPDYMLPPIYNSPLMNMLVDDELTTIRYDRHGYQVYELTGRRRNQAEAACNQRSVPVAWSRQEQLVIGGRKSFAHFTVARRSYLQGEVSAPWRRMPLFQRETTTLLSSAPVQVTGEIEDRTIELIMNGVGYVQIFAVVTDRTGELIERRLIGDLPLVSDSFNRTFSRRILLVGEANIQLEVEHRARSHVRIGSARIRDNCGA